MWAQFFRAREMRIPAGKPGTPGKQGGQGDLPATRRFRLKGRVYGARRVRQELRIIIRTFNFPFSYLSNSETSRKVHGTIANKASHGTKDFIRNFGGPRPK